MSNADSPGGLAPWRRSVVVLATLVVGLGTVLALALWPTSEPTPRVPFSSEAWRAPGSTQGNWSPRRAMVEDLFHRHLHIGMRRDEVERLLGPPDHEPWSDLHPVAGYSMGRAYPTSWGDFDTKPLLVTYDASGVVRELRLF